MKGKTGTLLMMSVVLAMALTFVVRAQAPAPAAPAGGGAVSTTAVAPKKAQWNTLWEMWVVGGPVMWPIGLGSIIIVGLCVYCGMQYRTDKMLRSDLLPQLQDALGKMDVAAAVNICDGSPSMLTNILAAGLRRIGADGEVDFNSVEKAMEEASTEEVNEGMKPLNNISILAQIEPMLGLLGTVTGMIGAFNKIGMGAMGDPEKLANDIGEAMITTAAGLIIAIPAMFAYFYWKGKYISNVARGSRIIGTLMFHFNESCRQVGRQTTGSATL
jgi:biopolymer transport protein ExbB